MEDLSRLIDEDKNKIPVPDLDWAVMNESEKDNIPTPNNVEILPQLQDAWSHTAEYSTQILPNTVAVVKSASEKIDTSGILKQAKKDMMLGLKGKELARKLGSLYPRSHIQAAKEDLVKLSAEQGLLGNVYIDLEPFDSCEDAARILGQGRIRTARYVVGKPKRRVCSSHGNGYCKELRKKVVASIDYSAEMLNDYAQHLKIAGVIAPQQKIASKEALQAAFLDTPKERDVPQKKQAQRIDPKAVKEKFSKELAAGYEKKAQEERRRRFSEVRPMLAYVQNQMLKGKIGGALKEAMATKYPVDRIRKYASELEKVSSLQGILGNVYVDVSYYKSPRDAISAIKRASTNPLYLVQTVKEHEFDDSIVKVAQATGCSPLPRDGKIDKKVVLSYIDDLQFSKRISMDTGTSLKKRVEAGEHPLKVLRDGFMATASHKREARQGGIPGYYAQGQSKKAASRDKLRDNVKRALEAGVTIQDIEDKLSGYIPVPESVGMVNDVLSKQEVVDSNSLTKCASERYNLRYDARLKESAKCGSCILRTKTSCLKQAKNFEGAQDMSKAFLDLDPKTQKVQFEENPSVERGDITQEYDMTGPFGSGMNITLQEMHNKKAAEVDIDFSLDGIDGNLDDL
jgi:hypothetical protein